MTHTNYPSLSAVVSTDLIYGHKHLMCMAHITVQLYMACSQAMYIVLLCEPLFVFGSDFSHVSVGLVSVKFNPLNMCFFNGSS